MRDFTVRSPPTQHPRKQASTGGDIHQAEVELQRSPYQAIRQIRCDLQEGVVTLTGCVPSDYEKQVAQTVVQLCLSGAATVRNELEVLAENPAHGTSVSGSEGT